MLKYLRNNILTSSNIENGQILEKDNYSKIDLKNDVNMKNINESKGSNIVIETAQKILSFDKQ